MHIPVRSSSRLQNHKGFLDTSVEGIGKGAEVHARKSCCCTCPCGHPRDYKITRASSTPASKVLEKGQRCMLGSLLAVLALAVILAITKSRGLPRHQRRRSWKRGRGACSEVLLLDLPLRSSSRLQNHKGFLDTSVEGIGKGAEVHALKSSCCTCPCGH